MGHCSAIRSNLAAAITAVWEANSQGKISDEEADKLAHEIAELADKSIKVCPVETGRLR